MSTATAVPTIGLQVGDVSGQKSFAVRNVPIDSTVGEVVGGLVENLELPKSDSNGRTLTYRIRLEREGRHLNASETVADVLQDEDQVTILPNIDAGLS